MQSSVFLVGQLVHWQEDVRTLLAGPATLSPLVYLQDSLSSRRFLIDSGASVSVFPAPRSSSTLSGVRLLTADGSSLMCSGSRIIPLGFGTHRFEWPFQLAPVAIPILVADFLKHFNLIQDVSNQRVFSADSPTFPPSSFQLLQILHQLHSRPISSPLQSSSRTSSPSFQM